MKAFLILEDGTVLTGESFGAAREVISEVVFNTSMTGYLEILTDPSYAGQSVVMTYPLIGNYGICMEDMESIHPWPKALIVRECAKLASNFRNEMTLDEFLKKYDVPGISGIDTRHLTRILREYGVMNGMITTREDFDLDEVVKQLKEYKVQGVQNNAPFISSCFRCQPAIPNVSSNIFISQRASLYSNNDIPFFLTTPTRTSISSALNSRIFFILYLQKREDTIIDTLSPYFYYYATENLR